MAMHEREWIERVRSGGGVPLLEPDNGWASPHGDAFMVRGADYPTTKEKVPGGDYLLEPLGFDWIKGPAKISEVLTNPKGRVRQALDEECAKGRSHFVWAFNFQLPTKDNHSIVAYFVGTEPSHQDPLICRFLNGDDGFRESRLKLIASVVKGPWVVKKAICIIGRALSCRYSMGEKLMQVDIDVGSSMVATAVVHPAFGYLTRLTVDLARVRFQSGSWELFDSLSSMLLEHCRLSRHLKGVVGIRSRYCLQDFGNRWGKEFPTLLMPMGLLIITLLPKM